MKRLLLLIPCVICLIFFFLLEAGCVNNKYLQRDAEVIRADILKETPIGSTIADVESKLRVKGLSPQISRSAGFLKQEKGTSVEVGNQSIRLHLGTYRSSLFSFTSVTVFWGFNDKSQLLDIWVWKTTDAP